MIRFIYDRGVVFKNNKDKNIGIRFVFERLSDTLSVQSCDLPSGHVEEGWQDESPNWGKGDELDICYAREALGAMDRSDDSGNWHNCIDDETPEWVKEALASATEG